jgi:hypothetical protein
VLNTKSVPCTVEPSAHSCGTAQKAEAVSSKKSDLSADADVENARTVVSATSATTTQRGRAEVVLNMFEPPRLMRPRLPLCNRQYRCADKADSGRFPLDARLGPFAYFKSAGSEVRILPGA